MPVRLIISCCRLITLMPFDAAITMFTAILRAPHAACCRSRFDATARPMFSRLFSPMMPPLAIRRLPVARCSPRARAVMRKSSAYAVSAQRRAARYVKTQQQICVSDPCAAASVCAKICRRLTSTSDARASAQRDARLTTMSMRSAGADAYAISAQRVCFTRGAPRYAPPFHHRRSRLPPCAYA